MLTFCQRLDCNTLLAAIQPVAETNAYAASRDAAAVSEYFKVDRVHGMQVDY